MDRDLSTTLSNLRVAQLSQCLKRGESRNLSFSLPKNSKITRQIPMSILILFLVVFPLIVVGNKYRIGVMTTVGINAIIVIGLNLLMGYAGQISLGHAAFFGIGAYSSGILTTKYFFHPVAAFTIGIFLSALIAFLVGKPTLRLKAITWL
jgi:branched-chain amino acid transport system permease protein